MSPELDQKLVKAFPLLYRDRNASMRTTNMCWGFDCGDGWFDIIWDLSAKLEREIKSWIAVTGFNDHPAASQVKEKYGSLRFYMTHETERIAKLIEAAEKRSETTCETCGKPGKIRGEGWLYCACEEHKR